MTQQENDKSIGQQLREMGQIGLDAVSPGMVLINRAEKLPDSPPRKRELVLWIHNYVLSRDLILAIGATALAVDSALPQKDFPKVALLGLATLLLFIDGTLTIFKTDQSFSR